MKAKYKRENRPGKGIIGWTPPSPGNNTVIILSTTKEDYYTSGCDLRKIFCPTCGSSVKYNSTYQKYLYNDLLNIVQVYCTDKDCKSTHAIIPSFSVPCCSTGTKELSQFIKARANGATVEEAGQCFIDAGMSPDYPEAINKRLKHYMRRIEFIFKVIEPTPCYAQLIFSITGRCPDPALRLTLLCYDSGFNPVLFSRSNILILARNKARTGNSYNPPCKPPP